MHCLSYWVCSAFVIECVFRCLLCCGLWRNWFKYWVCSAMVIESLWHVTLHTWALCVLCIEVVIKGIVFGVFYFLI